MLKDPLVRRFISASFFAGTFVWVAVVFFDVETNVVRVFLVLSVVFVLIMVFAGLLLSPLVSLFNRKPPLLAKLAEDEAIPTPEAKVSPEDRPS